MQSFCRNSTNKATRAGARPGKENSQPAVAIAAGSSILEPLCHPSENP